MDLYSPDCAVLHSLLGKKVFRKYSVQVRMKTDYISKVTLGVVCDIFVSGTMMFQTFII